MNSLINSIRYYPLYLWISYFNKKGGKILDFGCGKGELVFYLRQKGWHGYGIDPKIKIDIANSCLNKNMLFPSLTYFNEKKEAIFDVIILNFSLEHCGYPLVILNELHALLIPGGLIFIRVPNSDYLVRNKKLSSFQIKPDLHRQYFTPKSLKKLLEQCGFSVFRVDTRFCVTSALTIPCSIFPKLDPMGWLYEKNKIGKLMKGLVLGILCLIFSPYELIKSQIGQGAIIHAVAQKKT